MSRRDEVLKNFFEQENYTKEKVNSGIEENRKGYFKINIPGAKNIRIKANQKDHEFRFGANLFMLEQLETPEKNKMYKEYFAELFNMATLPFYWNTLEPVQGQPRYDKNSPEVYRRPPIDLCMEFCEEYGIEPREHALAYEHFFPAWLRDKDTFTIKKEYSRRCREIAERYADKIRTIEVTNETTGWGVEDNVSSFYEDDDFIEWCFKETEKYFPNNQLVINDFTGLWGNDARPRDVYYLQIERALRNGAKIDAIGMQYHMFHRREDETRINVPRYYNPWYLYRVMDLYSRFNKPLQVTEVTIPAYSNDAQDEDLQAEILKNLYSIWFSHKNMEQIIYWNTVDGYAYNAEPGDMTAGENYYYGGLIRFDFTKKPAYKTLYNLIHKEWKTNTEITTDDNGNAEFKGFYGKYDITFEVDGKTYTKEINCSKSKKNEFEIQL